MSEMANNAHGNSNEVSMKKIGYAKSSDLTNFSYFGYINGIPVVIYEERVRGHKPSLTFMTPKDENELNLVLSAISGHKVSEDKLSKPKEKEVVKGTEVKIDVGKLRGELKSKKQDTLF